jgi:hypothetical protein
MADIKDALHYCQTLLPSHPSSPRCPYFHFALAEPLGHTFERTEEFEYLNETISVLRVYFNTLGSLYLRLHSLRRLTLRLSTRLCRLRRREDSDEVMQLFPMAAQSEQVSLPHQLSNSNRWAARTFLRTPLYPNCLRTGHLIHVIIYYVRSDTRHSAFQSCPRDAS